MKKISLILSCLVCASIITVHAQSGTTGALTWSISGNTLTISGSGAMPDYYCETAPWYWYQFNTVIIGNGVTSIGNWAFFECYVAFC